MMSDIELLNRVCDADLKQGMDDEAVANGWSPSDTVARRVRDAERVYESRYGQPCPTNRSASWAIYHTPAGFVWECSISTRPDAAKWDHGYHATAAAVATGANRVLAEDAADKMLKAAIAAKGGIDSGIRETRLMLRSAR